MAYSTVPAATEQTPLSSATAGWAQHPKFRVFLAGIGFFTDAYDLFVVNVVLVFMRFLYPNEFARDAAGVATGALVGAVLGQLFFGFLADRIGRRIAFIATLSLVIVASFASAFVEGVGGASIYVTLAVVRFILGFGIGGEYPLAATITSESSAAASRGRSNALVFSMQGVGLLVAPCLALALFDTLGTDYDTMWRLLLGAGCVPGLVTIYWRLRMHETPHFTLAASVKESMTPAYKFRLIRRNARALAGTALNWLLLDIVFYANGLFSGIILSQARFVTSADHAAALRETIVASIYLALIAVPGYFCAVAIIDKHGRKPLQLWGFVAMATLYIILGALTTGGNNPPAFAFITLYGLTFFFTNCGPNMTTFVLPAETFPTEIRATCHGISAAAGKLGAVIGSAALAPALNAHGLPAVMFACGAVALVGAACTVGFTKETMGVELELAKEGLVAADASSACNTEHV